MAYGGDGGSGGGGGGGTVTAMRTGERGKISLARQKVVLVFPKKVSTPEWSGNWRNFKGSLIRKNDIGLNCPQIEGF